jgi:hypothetical protein
MRIKLFETFETPSFQEISDEEFGEKLDSRARASWTELEIEKVTKLFQEELGWKNCEVMIPNADLPAAFIWVAIPKEGGFIANWPFKFYNLYIVKQEDEWFFMTAQSLRTDLAKSFECDQFSGLEECIKQLFTK